MLEWQVASVTLEPALTFQVSPGSFELIAPLPPSPTSTPRQLQVRRQG